MLGVFTIENETKRFFAVIIHHHQNMTKDSRLLYRQCYVSNNVRIPLTYLNCEFDRPWHQIVCGGVL